MTNTKSIRTSVQMEKDMQLAFSKISKEVMMTVAQGLRESNQSNDLNRFIQVGEIFRQFCAGLVISYSDTIAMNYPGVGTADMIQMQTLMEIGANCDDIREKELAGKSAVHVTGIDKSGKEMLPRKQN